jgi:hypothetical protein
MKSTYEMWLKARTAGPVRGTFSVPRIWNLMPSTLNAVVAVRTTAG